MSKDTLLWIMLGEAVGIATLGALLRQLSSFNDRTLDDVAGFLRPISHQELERLFDPVGEQCQLQAFGNVRREQRARLDLSREYLGRMLHNTLIVSQWASTEWADMLKHQLNYDVDTRERILALRREAILFRLSASVVLARMWFWSLLHFDRWRFLPLPSVAGFRRSLDTDLLENYRKVKDSALSLALIYGQEHYRELDELM